MLLLLKQPGGEIPLASVGNNDDDQLAGIFRSLATSSAAHSAAPLEIPARIPSSRASRRAVIPALSLETFYDFIDDILV